MSAFFLFFLAAFFLAIPDANAEYRVFNLKISKQNPEKSQPPIERTVQTTLAPMQYKEYYPLDPEESIDYTETWMCKGRTDTLQDYCPNPKKAQIPEESVSNQSTP